MCEIRVSTGIVTPAHQVHEQGRGYVLLYDHGLHVIKGMNADDVEATVRKYRPPLLSVCHQRVPSAGLVGPQNVQPFSSGRSLAFCHNGTLDPEAYAILQRVFKHAPAGASDSRLLWELIRRLSFTDAVELLRELSTAGHHRFVLADGRRGRVALIGPWSKDDNGTWDRGSAFRGDIFDYVLLDRTGNILESRRKVSTPPWYTPRRIWEM